MADLLSGLIANLDAASAAFDDTITLDQDEAISALDAAIDALEAYTPRTADEFVRAFVARFDDALLPIESDFVKLVDQARAIVGGIKAAHTD